MTGLYAGAALGGMGGVLAERVGWAAGFQLFGGIGLLYGLVLAAALFDPPAAAAARSSPDAAEPAKPRLTDALASLLARPAFVVLLALNVLVGTVNWAVYGWLPTYLKDHFRLGLGEAGLSATGYIQAASFVGVLAAGALADRWSRSRRGRGARALVPAVGFLLAAPALSAAAMTDAMPVAVAGLLVFGLGRGAFDANQMPLLREIADERYSATGYGLLNLVSTAAGGVMVYAGGALLDAGVPLARVFQAAGGALFLASLLLFLVRRATVADTLREDADVQEPSPSRRVRANEDDHARV
jgi:sugar phosphate permease